MSGDEQTTKSVHDLAGAWWAERRELRPDAAWELPFPPRPEESARVLVQRAAGGEQADIWRAALLKPRAATAYIEVHSSAGPIGALVSLYEHVVPSAEGAAPHADDVPVTHEPQTSALDAGFQSISGNCSASVPEP